MNTLVVLLIIAVVLVVIIPIAVAGATWYSVVAMSKPEVCLRPASEHGNPMIFNDAAAHQSWAEHEGFDWLGAYEFNTDLAKISLAVWQHAGHPTYFVLYRQPSGKVFYDLVTIFSDNEGLTSGSTKDAFMLPSAPGSFVQSFPGVMPDVLWDRHLAAEIYLTQQCGIKTTPMTKPFEESLMNAIRRQMEYVKTIFLWPLRANYWYFIRRSLMANRSIEQQHQNGKLRFNQ